MMYNIRYFEYENGLQFRVYSSEVMSTKNDVSPDVCIFDKRLCLNYGHDVVDYGTGEIVWSDVDYVHGDDWVDMDDNFDFDMLEQSYKDELKRKRDDSVRSSVGRTKRNIVYLSRSNNWDWFVTFTLSPDKVDRYDYLDCSKKVRKFLNNLRRSVPDMVYLLVPELHQDGAWHFHGLMKNIESLEMHDSGLKDNAGREIYNMVAYKLGWSTCSRVGDSDKTANYVMKYITKDLCECTPGRQRYWCSNNINRAKVYEACVWGDELKELVDKLYEKMTWKKKILGEFQDVEIFEVPKDFFDKEDEDE